MLRGRDLRQTATVLGLMLTVLAAAPSEADWNSFPPPASAVAPAQTTTPTKRPIVTVLYFDNLSGLPEYDVFQKGLADMMVTDLVASDAVEVVEREKLQAIVAELNLQRTKYFDPATAQRIGKALGATHAVSGTIVAVEPNLRLSVRMVDLASSKVLAAEEVKGPKESLFELQQHLVELLLTSLNVKLGTAKPAVRPAGSVTALLSYAQAVDLADKGELTLAAARIAELLDAAPSSELAQDRRALLSRKLKSLGDVRLQQQHRTRLNLLAKSEGVTSAKTPLVAMGDLQAARHLTYRLIRVECLALDVKRKLTTTPIFSVPEGQETQVRAALTAYRLALLDLERDVDTWRGPWRWLPDPDDRAALEVLLISPPPMQVTAGNGAEVRLWRAQLAGLGLLVDGAQGFSMRPVLAELEPTSMKDVTSLFDSVADELSASKSAEVRERAVTVLDQKGRALLLLGKREAAVHTWQDALERFPQTKQFEALQQRVKQAVALDGPSRAEADQVRAFSRAAAACEPNVVQKLLPPVFAKKLREDGLWGIKPVVAELDHRCAEVPAFRPALTATLGAALEAAEKQSDCGYFDRLLAAYRRVDPSGWESVKAEHTGCE